MAGLVEIIDGTVAGFGQKIDGGGVFATEKIAAIRVEAENQAHSGENSHHTEHDQNFDKREATDGALVIHSD